MFEVAFTPEISPAEELEFAKQQVANLIDDPDWKWLRARINDEHLSWVRIMDLVAENS